MIFHWSLCDSKSPQISTTLLSIQADLNNAAVWIISTRPLISKSSSLCTIIFVTVSSILITIGITVTIMFYSIFSSLTTSRYLFVGWNIHTLVFFFFLIFIFWWFLLCWSLCCFWWLNWSSFELFFKCRLLVFVSTVAWMLGSPLHPSFLVNVISGI